MIYIFLILAFILFCITMIIIFSPAEFIIQIFDNNIQIKLVLFGIIKLRINDKTKKRNKRKRLEKKTFKRKVIFNFIKDILPDTKGFFSKTHVRMELDLKLGMSSADTTAKVYGLVNLILYNLDILFSHFFNSYIGEYNISPDFINETKAINLTIYFKVRQVDVFSKGLRVYKKYKKFIKGGVINVGASN